MRYVIGFSFAALALWVLWATGAIMAVLVFLMVGAVPGTQLSVPPSAMFGILGLCMIAMFYWLSKLNLPAQVKELRETYHSQASHAAEHETASSRQEAHKKPHLFQTLIVALALRAAVVSRPIRAVLRHAGAFLVHAGHGLLKLIVVLSHAILHLTKTVTSMVRPHLASAAAWTKKQISYSVKGTILSAHRWSSLKRKTFDSGAWALKRCSSALKRVKSLLIRSAR